jgi:hypothetical protein
MMDFAGRGGEGLRSYVLTFNSLTDTQFSFKDNILFLQIGVRVGRNYYFLIICVLTFSFSSISHKFCLMKMGGRKQEFTS